MEEVILLRVLHGEGVQGLHCGSGDARRGRLRILPHTHSAKGEPSPRLGRETS